MLSNDNKMSLTDKIKGKIGKSVASLLIGSGLVGSLGGCETTPAGYAFGQFLVTQGVASAIEGELDPKGTTINFNGSTPIKQWDYLYYTNPKGEYGCILIIFRERTNKYVYITKSDGEKFIVPSKYVIRIEDNVNF